MRVMLRCRPLSDGEVADGRKAVVSIEEPAKRVTLNAARAGEAGARSFAFDAVFGPSCPQQKVSIDGHCHTRMQSIIETRIVLMNLH